MLPPSFLRRMSVFLGTLEAGAAWPQSQPARGSGRPLGGSERPRKWVATPGSGGTGTPRGRARNAAFPPPQGSRAQRMTTSCGPRLMSGATSVCWGTRLFSNGGPPMPRALTEKTLTGRWSCPTAPAPGRTMNGWLSSTPGTECSSGPSAVWATGWGVCLPLKRGSGSQETSIY